MICYRSYESQTQSDKIKHNFFQAVVVLVLLYGCTTWMLTKCIEKRLDWNCTRILRTIMNKSWKQHPSKQQLYSYQPPISKTIQIRRTRHVELCWRSNEELINYVLLWTPSQGRACVRRLARIYQQKLYRDTKCSLEDLPEAMDDRDEWWGRVREICASSVTWWWYICPRDSFRVSVFVRSAISSVFSESVIVFTGYHLLPRERKQNWVDAFKSRRSHIPSKWMSSEISWQVQVPLQLHLIYWK